MASEFVSSELVNGMSSLGALCFSECIKEYRLGNISISPLSLVATLSLLAQASDDDTFEEIRKGLKVSGDKINIMNQFSEIYSTLKKSACYSNLLIANRMYIKDGYQINQNFRRMAFKKFYTDVETLDLSDATHSANAINLFIREKTTEGVKDAIKPDKWNPENSVVLVNTVCFIGEFEQKFEKKRTFIDIFHIDDNYKSIAYYMMVVEKQFNYGKFDDLEVTALEMNYANSDLAFLILLPYTNGGLRSLEYNMQDYDLSKIIQRMKVQDVHVAIPKFHVEYDLNLKIPLENLGMTNMFKNTAIFNGVLESSEQFNVSQIVQKVIVDMSEEAYVPTFEEVMSTRFCCAEKANAPGFIANHSFLYFVRDTKSGAVLVNGRIKNIVPAPNDW